jgi:hypothetical protein
MSAPSFSSFPNREPQKSHDPILPSLLLPLASSLANDESSIAGPSFSSFPARPSKLSSRTDAFEEATSKLDDSLFETHRKRRTLGSSREGERSSRELDREQRRKRDKSKDREGHKDKGSRSHRSEKSPEPSRKRRRDDRRQERDSSTEKRRDREKLDDAAGESKRHKRPDEPLQLEADLDKNSFYTDTRGDQDIFRFGPQRGMKYIPSGREYSPKCRPQ